MLSAEQEFNFKQAVANVRLEVSTFTKEMEQKLRNHIENGSSTTEIIEMIKDGTIDGK